jgi:ABC-type Fe3+-hydroxamate transport system substrate-binding protein
MVGIKDQLNRIVNLHKKPQRIISLVPSLTELLADLGLQDKIVGVTRFCVHPTDIRKKAKVVGGTKQVRNKKISKLQPDLILANKEENQPEDIKKLEKICPVHVSDVQTIEDCYELIDQYGRLTDTAEEAKKMNDQLKNAYADFRDHIVKKPQLKVAYLIWKDPWMAVGGDSFIHEMLKVNHYDNIFKHQKRYPEIKLADLQKADHVFLSTEPYPFKEENAEELPVDPTKVKIVDGEYFSWYGSRLLGAFDYFREIRSSIS